MYYEREFPMRFTYTSLAYEAIYTMKEERFGIDKPIPKNSCLLLINDFNALTYIFCGISIHIDIPYMIATVCTYVVIANFAIHN